MTTGTTSSKTATAAAGGGRRRTPTAMTSGAPRRRLVIVESGTKAAKIQKFLGKDYVVEASVGHIRDLPRGAADVPAKYKGESWARLGVDVDNSFAPLYIITPEKKGKVAELKDALKSVDEVLLATDPDREGEAIAWHLLDTLKPKVPVRRMVFHEISEPAIRAAVENLRDLDHDLVDAQETRRILDRLYGYEVSPVLWKKVMPKLSAGRVQSVATRIIVAARAGADGVRLRGLLGHRRRARRGRQGHAAAVPGAARGRRRHPRCDRPRLRPRRSAQGHGDAHWTRRRRGGWPRPSKAATWPSSRSSPSRTRASPTPRS